MDFFPQTLKDWVALILQIVAILSALAAWTLRYIRGPLLEQINGLGGRVKKLESAGEHDRGKVEGLERSDERTNFQIATLSERQGRIEGRQEKLDEWFDEFETRVVDANTLIQQRLSSIEGKLDIWIRREK